MAMLRGEPAAERVRSLVVDEEPAMCSVNLGEVLYSLLRTVGPEVAADRVEGIRQVVEVIDPGWSLVEASARIKAEVASPMPTRSASQRGRSAGGSGHRRSGDAVVRGGRGIHRSPKRSSLIAELVADALAEDVGQADLTTVAVVPDGARARARIEQRQPGVIFGLDVAAEVFRQAGHGELEFNAIAVEGSWRDGGEVASIEGPAAGVLAGERVALNLLGRLSGVATLTARYVAAVAGTPAGILDTRKTTPGLRRLEKAAVVAGGGLSHRAGLHDAILVKENHVLLAGGVGQAARHALANRGDAQFVEVEVESLAELEEVLEAGVERVLLDDMSLDDMREGTRRAHAAAPRQRRREEYRWTA